MEVDNDDMIISCENIHKTYLLGTEGFPALRGVAMTVKKGEFLLVYGTSGGGKSTLLNILGTIDVPTKGNFYLFGDRITEHTIDSQLARVRCERIGFVFQSFNLLPSMNAIGNVSLPMIIAGKRSPAEIKERAKKLLQLVKLGDRLQHLPSMMSGGEQQRVTIARALANEPEILLLDEPTGDLDTENMLLVMSILTKLNKEHGLTMVMVTHDVYMKQYAHRILYMRDGKVQNVEKIDSLVRENALQKLWEETEKVLNGTRKEENFTVSSFTRPPSDYSTIGSQADISFDEDPEMWKVVKILFSV